MKKLSTILLGLGLFLSSALYATGTHEHKAEAATIDHMGNHMHEGKMTNHMNMDGMTDEEMKKNMNKSTETTDHMNMNGMTSDNMENNQMDNAMNKNGMKNKMKDK